MTEFSKILILFFSWRVLLFGMAVLAVLLIPNFGGRFPYYNEVLVSTNLPSWVWGFGNFDGVHYLNIAKQGYLAQYTQAFFPFYPSLISLLSFGQPFWAGLLISNIAFLAALFLLYRLFMLDFSRDVARWSVILLLTFPTAFYFGAVYSESLFLLFVVASLFFVRKMNFLISGFFALLASATRLFGLFLAIVLVIELISFLKSGSIKVGSKIFYQALTGIFLAPLGTAFYMIYLKLSFNDPLYFLNAQPAFGADRSSQSFVLLPQVIFRYIKMLAAVPANSLSFLNVSLELLSTLIPLTALFLFYKKVRSSYLIFTAGCLILPTLTGTLSSMPRYALMSFLIFPLIAQSAGKNFKFIVLFLAILEAILLGLFVRGYWVA